MCAKLALACFVSNTKPTMCNCKIYFLAQQQQQQQQQQQRQKIDGINNEHPLLKLYFCAHKEIHSENFPYFVAT